MSEPWTPGPWALVLGAVFHDIDMVAAFAQPDRVKSADARLIALAPEMAEVLARMLQATDYRSSQILAEKARHVLKRARGEMG